jgi:hypothetical protein
MGARAVIRIGVLTAAALLFAGAARADVCSGDGVAEAADAVTKASRALPQGEDETDVPEAGRRAIAAMKDRVDGFTRAVLSCQGEAPGAAAVKRALSRFGKTVEFEVRIPAASKDLLAVRARFGIPCGDDAMLMVFARRDGAWTPVLRAQSKPYATIGGAWGTFDYAISKPDADGHWFVIVKSVAPWCSSTWSEIDYAILRPGADPLHPATLHEGRDEMWWGGDNYGTLKAGTRDAELRFDGSSVDGGLLVRPWIRHYAVDGDVVRRTAPFAENPRDFADEWTVSAWKQAGPWSDKRVLARLRRLHDELHNQGGFGYDRFAACTDDPNHIQIGVDNGYYFQVDAAGGYRMLDVTRRPDPHCTLPDTIDPPPLE